MKTLTAIAMCVLLALAAIGVLQCASRVHVELTDYIGYTVWVSRADVSAELWSTLPISGGAWFVCGVLSLSSLICGVAAAVLRRYNA